MTATDELRRMLDERGVEWRAYTDLTRGAMELFHSTYFDMPNGCKARAASIIDSDLVLLTFRTTPEQAIAATLGETDNGCYLMRDGKKFPVELDYGFLGIMPIAITVGGLRYLIEVPNEE